MTPADRVRTVLSIASHLEIASDPLGKEARDGLAALGTLSHEGIDLALREHVETIEHADLDALMASVTPSRRVWVVASANVCVAAIRAIALALAASDVVRVKPSRRDPVVARILVRELARAGLDIAEVDRIAPDAGDAVHAYGADATLDSLRASLPSSVHFEGHGTGFGVAIVDANLDESSAAEAIARDVVPFDQMGCLSPRVVILEGDATRARTFSIALSRALDVLGRGVPRGALGDAERASITAYESMVVALGGDLVRGADHVVGFEADPPELLLTPGFRVVHVAACSTIDAATRPLAKVADLVTALGGAAGPLTDAIAHVAPGARRSALGVMQRPPLDGPVDRRRRVRATG